MINPYEIYQRSRYSFEARKSYGEIFTPNDLIDEMLDTLPAEVWANPTLTWLDPAAGVGNFFALAFNRLMKGLKDCIPNSSKRRRHILEEMFFFVELQPKNIEAIKEIFGRESDIRLNIFQGDFEEFSPSHFGFEAFDIVLGNPPYQHMHTLTSRKAKNHNLWSIFIEKGFNHIREGGYLLYVTPPAWMSPSSRLLTSIFLKHQLHVINLNECSKYFKGIGSNFSYYLLEKTPVYTETKFIYEFKGGSKIKSSKGVCYYQLKKDIKFIPQLPNEEVFSILEKTVFADNEKIPVRYDSDLHRFTKKHLLSTQKGGSFKFKVLHTPKQTIWSMRPHKTHGSIKVLIPLTTYFESVLIDDCGITQGMGYVLCKDEKEAKKLRDLLQTPLYRLIANVTRWSNFNVPLVMQKLPAYFGDPTDEKILYDYFNLNERERNLLSSLLPTENRQEEPAPQMISNITLKLAFN